MPSLGLRRHHGRHHHHQPPLARSLPFVHLTVVPVLLAVATVVVIFLGSDVNAALLWSQCHARARLPVLSHVPLVGSALCYLPSFFHEALASARSAAVMAVILAFVGALLTVSLVEAARPCNARSPVVARPTGPWLLFNLLGGAAVWQLLIVPAFLYRAQRLYGRKDEGDEAGEDAAGSATPRDVTLLREIPEEEVLAIPLSVTLGYYVPAVLMLALNSPAVICVWLLFPVLVSLLRQATRWSILRWKGSSSTVHLESSRPGLLLVYTLPITLSILAHVACVGHLTLRSDDRKEMTRSTVALIGFDAQAIGWTVLYWLLVEVGWEAAAALLTTSFIVGPGAATCLTWAFVREHLFQAALDTAAEEADGEPDEESPLLR